MNKSVSLPSFPLGGGCQCGNVRYKLSGAPIVLYFCHCTECQKQSSSAFGQSMRIEQKDLNINGSFASFTRSASSGNNLVYDFCPNCGTRLFHRRANYADTLNIKAGTLDDTSWLKPAGHIWTKSKQGWFEITPGDLNYETQPKTYDALIERWQKMTGAS